MTYFLRGLAVSLLAVAALAGCGNPPPEQAGSPPAAPQEAILQAGDVTIRASTVQTSALAPAIAAQYGLPRGDQHVMLLVGLRRGAEGQDASVPAQVSVTATDLRGQRHPLPMRELRSGELVDYVGTLELGLPDTLRFDLQIVHDGQTSTMQFSREFYPR